MNARLLRKWAAAKAAKSKKSGIVSPVQTPVKSPKIPVRPSPALRPASPVSPVSESPRPITKFINPISRFLTRRLSKTPSQNSSPMSHRPSPPPTPSSKIENQIQTTRQPIQ